MRAVGFSFVVSLVVFALLSMPGPGSAFCVILEPPTPLPTQVNGTQVEIQLTEGFARVVIIKEFYNPSDEFRQGQIAFPLEKGHELITDLRLKIGNVVYNSSAQNRSGALDEFLDAIAKGQDAALVQYDPPRDLYWIAVTIPPRQARTTITTLEMPLRKADGFYEYGYRLSIDARDSVSYLRVHVRVETVAPLGDVLLPGHADLPVLRSGSHRADAYINATQGAGTRDLDIRFRAVGASLSQFAEPTKDRYVRFSLDVTDPAFASSIAAKPRALLFLLDASGSMTTNDRWTLTKQTVRQIAADLGAGESYGVAVFQGATVTPFASSLRSWSPASEAELLGFLDSVRPHGSTSLAAPLAQAAQWAADARRLGQQPILVLVSDGRPTRAPVDPELETAYARVSYDGDMPVFAMAVQPSDHADETVLYNLSHYHGGELVVVHRDVLRAAAELLGSLRVPLLQGVRPEIPDAVNLTIASADPQTIWQGGEAFVIAKMRGTENDSLDLRMGWSDPTGVGHRLDIQAAGTDIPSQSLLKRQWVLTRIHALLEAAHARADSAAIDEVTALATENRVATPYTSLLVLLPQERQSAEQSSTDFFSNSPIFGGVTPTSSPSGFRSSSVFVPPLVGEAQKADALRRDFANPLVTQDEVDRYVAIGSPESAALDVSGATSRYEGTYLRIFDVGDELVGVTRLIPDPSQGVANAFGIAGVVLSIVALTSLPRRRAKPRPDA